MELEFCAQVGLMRHMFMVLPGRFSVMVLQQLRPNKCAMSEIEIRTVCVSHIRLPEVFFAVLYVQRIIAMSEIEIRKVAMQMPVSMVRLA